MYEYQNTGITFPAGLLQIADIFGNYINTYYNHLAYDYRI